MCCYLSLLTVFLIGGPNYWQAAFYLVGLGTLQHIQCLRDVIYLFLPGGVLVISTFCWFLHKSFIKWRVQRITICFSVRAPFQALRRVQSPSSIPFKWVWLPVLCTPTPLKDDAKAQKLSQESFKFYSGELEKRRVEGAVQVGIDLFFFLPPPPTFLCKNN